MEIFGQSFAISKFAWMDNNTLKIREIELKNVKINIFSSCLKKKLGRYMRISGKQSQILGNFQFYFESSFPQNCVYSTFTSLPLNYSRA